MTRKAFPYTPFDHDIEPLGIPRTALPMDLPTLEYRNHYRHGTRIGEEFNTKGARSHVVHIQTPHDTSAGGPGTTKPVQGMHQIGRPRLAGAVDGSVASNTVTGGVVKGYITDPDSIRVNILVSRNLYSPTSHANDHNRLAASGKIPPVNAVPSKDRGMPPKMGKRGTGGNYTIPAPQVIPSWPTSAQWLKSRFG
jgi:hypothetical protein